MRETWVLSLAWEDPLEKGMATHSSILVHDPMDSRAWRAAVCGVTRVRHDWETNTFTSLSPPLYFLSTTVILTPFWVMGRVEGLLKTAGSSLETCSDAPNTHIQSQGLSMLLHVCLIPTAAWLRLWIWLPSTIWLKSHTSPPSALCLSPFRSCEFFLMHFCHFMFGRTYYYYCLNTIHNKSSVCLNSLLEY